MLLESKMKQVAIMAAVDVRLKKMKYSPERCSRNLLELGLTAFPGKISKQEQAVFLEHLLKYCKDGDIPGAKGLFIYTFLKEQAN